MPAVRCCCTLRRRAFLILFLRRRDRFEGGVEEFAAVYPLAAAVLRLAGVHFSSCFSDGMVVSNLSVENLPPYARWPQSFFAMPACILILFHRRRDRFDGGVEEFAAVCPLAAAVLRFAGVHF